MNKPVIGALAQVAAGHAEQEAKQTVGKVSTSPQVTVKP
jgi:hypothetical protein